MNNGKVIQYAFLRLERAKADRAYLGLKRVLESAMKQALRLHDDKHRKHVELGDNYGWAVVHNGTLIQMGVNAKPGTRGEAAAELRKVAAECGSGWQGILMAGMGNKRNYYAFDYELDILIDTIDFTRDNFWDYFHKI